MVIAKFNRMKVEASGYWLRKGFSSAERLRQVFSTLAMADIILRAVVQVEKVVVVA
jgi:hypothetical protein